MTSAVSLQALPSDEARDRFGWLGHIDWPLAFVALALMGLGLVMVTSASMNVSMRASGDAFAFALRHALYLSLALGAAWIGTRVPAQVWERAGPWLLFVAFALLALVLVPGIGKEVNGASRWLRAGPVTVQPAEMAKLFVLVYLAGYLVRRSVEVRRTMFGFIKPILVLIVMALLLLAEPDFGTTAVLFACAFGMLFLAGVPLATFAGWFAIGLGLLALLVWIEPYRLARLLTFLDPWADPYASGFQLTQALMAVGQGGWFGVGLGNSVQKLSYLPEAHTDFVFAVMVEELGLLAGFAVVLAYGFMSWRALAISRLAHANEQPFAGHLAAGLGLLLAVQSFINIGVNLGLLPTKGLTLPLISYGGSSLVMSGLGLGILLRLAGEAPRRPPGAAVTRRARGSAARVVRRTAARSAAADGNTAQAPA